MATRARRAWPPASPVVAPSLCRAWRCPPRLRLDVCDGLYRQLAVERLQECALLVLGDDTRAASYVGSLMPSRYDP
jgi:hypothetical protein